MSGYFQNGKTRRPAGSRAMHEDNAMPWILNEVNRPVFVGLGSPAMMAARNCYVTEDEAKHAQRQACLHDVWIGHSSTGYEQCADCGRTAEDIK